MRLKKPLKVPLPKTRDPLVNTPLTPVGRDAKGNELFWISSVSQLWGAMGLVVDEWGNCRKYSFRSEHKCFYSAIRDADQPNVLWLAGSLDYWVRLDLKTGKWNEYATGLPRTRITSGARYDAKTGKILNVGKPYIGRAGYSKPVATVFSTRERKLVKSIELPFDEGIFTWASFPDGDGRHTLLLEWPGLRLLHWDPATDEIEHTLLPAGPNPELTHRLVSDNNGRWYFPERGWYNPRTRQFEKPVQPPEHEMVWFGRHGDTVYGGDVSAWDLRTGKVTRQLTIPDGTPLGVNLTTTGKLVAVSMFGIFYRYDLATGALEATRVLPTDEHGVNEALCRIDKDRVIGAPYISAQFWTLNLRTKKGENHGRGQTVGGQICHLKNVRGKIYMAAYVTGELMEYDPDRPTNFPFNPRIVADAPGGVRPNSLTTDGARVFYTCNKGPELGSVFTRYDTKTGRVEYRQDLLPAQALQGLFYDKRSRSVVCGSTPHADGKSRVTKSDRCIFARIDADDLTVKESAPAPAGVEEAVVIGELDSKRWLCRVTLSQKGLPRRLTVLERDNFGSVEHAPLQEFPAKWHDVFLYTGKPGKFLLNIEDRLEAWDMRRQVSLGTVFRRYDNANIDGYHVFIEGNDLFVMRSRKVEVVENAFKGM